MIFAIFFVIPLGTLIVTSFSRWGLLGFEWTGTENYDRLIHDAVFWKAVKNTALYAACGRLHPGPDCGDRSRTILLPSGIRGWRVFRTILFIPVVISGATYALIFATFYNARYGPLNRILDLIGVEGRDWLFEIPDRAAGGGRYVHLRDRLANGSGDDGDHSPFRLEFSEAAEVDGASRVPAAVLHHAATAQARDRHVRAARAPRLRSHSSSRLHPDERRPGRRNRHADGVRISLSTRPTSGVTRTQIGIFIVVTGFLLILTTRRLFRLGEREL